MKGPSAMYSADAANGVIVISTKKGHAGATRWTWVAGARRSPIAILPDGLRDRGSPPMRRRTGDALFAHHREPEDLYLDSLPSFNVLRS